MFLTTPKTFAVLAAGLLALQASPAVPAQDPTFDSPALNAVEELSESLANDLLSLSLAVRDRDRRGIEQYLAHDLEATPLPALPGPLSPELKWISTHPWLTDGEQTGKIGRRELLDSFEKLLGHFSSIEDVRFKVKAAEFGPGASNRGSARVWTYIVGRDFDGRREWLTWWARVEAVRGPPGAARLSGGPPTATDPRADSALAAELPPWQLRRIEIEPLRSMVAEVDLFSEVALPAGTHQVFPAFGTPPNDTVIAHGAAVADANSDGLLDVVTTGVESNRLYVNRGDGRFEDVSEESLVGLAPAATGALWVDVDNDGDSDLFLARLGEQVLLENRLVPDGELLFYDRSLEAGVAVPAVGFTAVAADVNGDGWQDIYVASYNRYGLVMPNAWDRATNGTPNLFFLNQGGGTFREVAASWGVQDSRWSYAAGFADVDEDGDQDLYVPNDFGENGLYLNEGDHFREAAAERGVLDPGNGMGVSFGDYDNDGDLDLHVTNMSSTAGNRILARLYPDASPDDSVLKKIAAGNSLFENDGSGRFRDVSRSAGGFSAGWAFGGGFIDFDNDGWEDVYSPNGFISGKTMNDT